MHIIIILYLCTRVCIRDVQCSPFPTIAHDVVMRPKGHFAIEVDECDRTSVSIIRGQGIVISAGRKKRKGERLLNSEIL